MHGKPIRLLIYMAAFSALFMPMSLAACSGGTPALKQYEKLWNVDIAQKGFVRSAASFSVDRRNETTNLSFWLQPEAYAGDITAGRKPMKENGRAFNFREGAVNWDGEGGAGGVQYSRELTWANKGFAYNLFADTGEKDISLDMVSPGNALKLEKQLFTDVPGFPIQWCACFTEFRSEKIIVSITMFPYPYVTETLYESIKEMDPVSVNGLDYYAARMTLSQDDAVASSMIWKTDIGIFELRAGVPWMYRNDVREEELDVFNMDMAKSICAQMGCTIIKFDETKK